MKNLDAWVIEGDEASEVNGCKPCRYCGDVTQVGNRLCVECERSVMSELGGSDA